MGKQPEKFVILAGAWIVIIITFIILWVCALIKLLHTVEVKYEGEEMDHYNVRSHKCEIPPQPELTLQHQECLAYRGSKDVEEVLSTDAHKTFNIKGSPPDFFVINEYFV